MILFRQQSYTISGVGAEHFGYTELFLMCTFLHCLFHRAHQIRMVALLNSISIVNYSHPCSFTSSCILGEKHIGGCPNDSVTAQTSAYRGRAVSTCHNMAAGQEYDPHGVSLTLLAHSHAAQSLVLLLQLLLSVLHHITLIRLHHCCKQKNKKRLVSLSLCSPSICRVNYVCGRFSIHFITFF